MVKKLLIYNSGGGIGDSIQLLPLINTYEVHKCPRGEIGRHKGLKILALLGVPVRVWPRAPLI